MMKHSGSGATFFFLLAVLSLIGATEIIAQDAPGAAPVDRIAIEAGSGSFVVSGGGGYAEKEIRVYYHKPTSFQKDSPVLMVIPGAGRNGDDYRDAWVEASEQYGVLILSPTYPKRYYPEYWSYNLAGMTGEVTLDLRVVIDTKPEEWRLGDVARKLASTIGMHELVGHGAAHQLIYQFVLLSKAGMIDAVNVRGLSSVANRDPDRWIFGDFDRIFELVKGDLNLEAQTYDLFGHSAGGQILHRLAIFHPSSKADQILAANSGWYTVPTFEQQFPYGLKGSGISKDQLQAAFGTNLVVFLGEEDDADETRGSLRRTPQANSQGSGRFERGKYFFVKAQEAARAFGVDFEWTLEIVPGVGHDYQRMSHAAAEYLYGG